MEFSKNRGGPKSEPALLGEITSSALSLSKLRWMKVAVYLPPVG